MIVGDCSRRIGIWGARIVTRHHLEWYGAILAILAREPRATLLL